MAGRVGPKRPNDSFVVAVSYKHLLAPGDELTGTPTFKVYDPDGAEVTVAFVSGSPSIAGAKVQARLKTGTNTPGIYTIDTEVDTLLGDHLTDITELEVIA